MLADIGIYTGGLIVGVLASVALDVQLRRPGIRQGIGLVAFAFLLWGALSVTHTAFSDVLLPLLWAGTGAIVGLGSREATVSH